jgi:hypothetical protein
MTAAQFLVDFSPEPLLEVLLGPLERLVVLEGVKVGKHAHDPGEAVHLGKCYSKFGEIFLGDWGKKSRPVEEDEEKRE